MPSITEAARRLDDLLEKQPELSAYKFPASAGDMDALGKKLDEIAELLRRLVGDAEEFAKLKSVLGRFLAVPPSGESLPQARHAPSERQSPEATETDQPSAAGGPA
jgi:hypothetical protein